jgi:hypothetical protein
MSQHENHIFSHEPCLTVSISKIFGLFVLGFSQIPPDGSVLAISDEDIPTVDTTTTHPHVQGPLTRARARQLNY